MRLIDYLDRHVHDIDKRVLDWYWTKKASEDGIWLSNPCYASVISKNCGEIYETIYGIKVLKGKPHVQKLFVVTEKGKTWCRNCWYEYYCMASGFHSYGYTGHDKKGSAYCSDLYYSDVFDDASDIPDERIGRYIINGPEMASFEDSLRYCHFTGGCPPMQYLRIYRKWPKQAEMLMKFGLQRMLTEKNAESLSHDPMFHRWLERHHEQCHGMAYRTAYNAYKKNPQGNPGDYAKSLSYRLECGKKLATEDKEMYERLLRHTTRERLCEWLSDNSISPRVYYDYLRACEWLRLNLDDTKVLYPKNFQEVHDDYTRQYGEYKNRLEAEKAKAVSDKMGVTAERFAFLSYSADGYQVKVAHNKLELINEGANLSICVGRMDYDRRQADGRSVICFIRRKEEPERSFVCAEISVSDSALKLVQCYGERNSVVPEIKQFTDLWVKEANRRYKHAV